MDHHLSAMQSEWVRVGDRGRETQHNHYVATKDALYMRDTVCVFISCIASHGANRVDCGAGKMSRAPCQQCCAVCVQLRSSMGFRSPILGRVALPVPALSKEHRRCC